MAVRNLYADITGITGFREITLNQSMAQAAATAEIVTTAHSLDIGDLVTIDIGYVDEHEVMLTDGIVKEITWRRPEQNYLITVSDKLVRAVDYFIASDDPDSPLEVSNIEASALVGLLLDLADVTPYSGDGTIFTYAVTQPTKINLVSAWQMIETISRVCGCLTFCQADGTVRFTSRKPYIVGTETTEHEFITGSGGDIETISYLRSDEWLRNRIAVYGLDSTNIFASASAVSPYLPAGFYKTLVVAHELIDTQAEAQRTADVNLEMFNRLTETVSLQALGKPSIQSRDIVEVTESFSGLSGDQFVVFGAEHHLGPQGYSMGLTLTR